MSAASGHAQNGPRAALPDRVAVDPRQRRHAGPYPRAGAFPRRPEIAVPVDAARPPARRAHGAPPAPGTDRHLRADQGPGGLPDGERLRAQAPGLDGAVVPRDGGDDLAWLADREAPPLLRGPHRGWLAGAGPARPAGDDPGRHAAPPRGRPRLRGAVPRRRRRGDGVLRRRRDQRGRLPRGAELRGRLARARRVRLPEQPVGDLGAAQEADALADDRPEGAGLRAARHPGRRQRRARRLRRRARGRRARARGARGRP